MRLLFRLSLILLFVVLVVAPASAGQIISSPTGLAAPAATITFSEYPIAQGTIITNQFAGLGASFSPNLYYDPQTGLFPTAALGNFDPIVTPFTINFTVPQSDAAFQFITNAGTSTFEALLGGTIVDSFSAQTGIDYLFFGFTQSTFDAIRVTPGGSNNAMLMDNLQLGTAVPEPGTLGLLALGLVASIAFRRRA